MTAEKLLTLARGEVGTVEFPPNSNKVKYNTAYYGREVSGSGYPWCCVFLWWLFQEAGAGELFYGGKKTAYCPTLLAYYKGKGRTVDEPRPGDIVFFNFSGKGNAAHVGLCESWDGAYVTTIDGNTGSGSEANGGAVMRRRRHKKYIVGVARPQYEEAEELDEQRVRAVVREELDAWLAEQDSRQPTQQWQLDGLARAVEKGVTDGSRPMGLCTRLEAAMMAAKAKEG